MHGGTVSFNPENNFGKKNYGPKPCRFGPGCKKINNGCTFSHDEPQDSMQADGFEMNNNFDNAPSSGPPKGGMKGSCNNFAGGKCYRVRCNYLHILPGSNISVKFNTEAYLFGNGKEVVSSVMVNNKTQVGFAVSDSSVSIMDV